MVDLVAAVAVETGIPPSTLLAEQPRFFWAMCDYLQARAERQREAAT